MWGGGREVSSATLLDEGQGPSFDPCLYALRVRGGLGNTGPVEILSLKNGRCGKR